MNLPLLITLGWTATGLACGGVGALVQWALSQGRVDRAYSDGYDDRRRWEQGPADDDPPGNVIPIRAARPDLAAVPAPPPPGAAAAGGGRHVASDPGRGPLWFLPPVPLARYWHVRALRAGRPV